MVIKRHKGKASLLARVAVGHDVNNLDFAKLLKVIPQMGLLCVFLNAANKDLLHGYMGTGSV